MEYRQLPKGQENERLSVLGLGLGGVQACTDSEIERAITCALEGGVNFFDLCAGGQNVYAPFGRAIAGAREKVFFQLHFGAVYNDKGEYGFSRDPEKIKRAVEWELKTLGTDYADMGFLHCVDEDEDYDQIIESGVMETLWTLHMEGVVRHIGFSSHTPAIANRILDTGIVDMMMLSLNPAYDFEKGDAYGAGEASERAELLQRCQREGVGISVMKPFCAGKLLSAETSPFKRALTREQCIQYALDRPGVLAVVPGVRGLADVQALLHYPVSTAKERDYSVIGGFTPETMRGTCVYCNHCQPCPAGIDVGLINKYYDLARAGDKLALSHYDKLSVKANACAHCGHCDKRCPFGVLQSARMTEIADYFDSAKDK